MTKHWTILAVGHVLALLALCASVPRARADIFQWEYINPADPSQGKQQSTTLAPDGAGVNAARGTNLSNFDLTKAYLIGANLGPEILSYDEYGYPIDYVLSNLANVILRQADLSYASFLGATLTGADLTGADVRRAFFGGFNGQFHFGGTGITLAQLYSTASYQAHDLTGISLAGNNTLVGIDLAGQNLTGAYIAESMPQANLSQANLRFAWFDIGDLTGANLSGADVRNANFVGTGLTTAQLYSTASYQAHDLTGIALPGNVLTGANLSHVKLTGADLRAVLDSANLTHANLTGANFSGNYFYWGGADLSGANLSHANLTNASFSGDRDSPGANLTNANLTGADARGADFYRPRMDGAVTTNLIQSDGRIEGLDLTDGASLIVRDYDGNPSPIPNGPLPIVVDQHLTMYSTGTLQLEFDADPWDSTISFEPGIPVALGGTLGLSFSPDVDLESQIGRTLDLFDWTGVTPTGAFTVSSPYAWNLANLYTTGEVTLLSVGTAGDFDLDGDVDGRDFLARQRNPSVGNLADWQANYGTGNLTQFSTAAEAASPVPEPGSVVFAACGLIAFTALRRKNRKLTHPARRYSPGRRSMRSRSLAASSYCSAAIA